MPEERIPGRMYPSGHANEGVHAIMALLEDWFLAMENGTAIHRQPDHTYLPRRRPIWTEEQLDRLMRDMDAEIDQEVDKAPGTSTGSQLGSGFQRLETPQRLAFAQQLDALITQHYIALGPDYP